MHERDGVYIAARKISSVLYDLITEHINAESLAY